MKRMTLDRFRAGSVGAVLGIAAFLSAISTPAQAAAAASASCAVSATGGMKTVSIRSGGRVREFKVYLPGSYTGRQAIPLVFDLHGSSGSGEAQAINSSFEKTAEKHGFAVAWPDGGISLPAAPQEHYWNIYGLPLTGNRPIPADAPNDVQFFSDAIDQLASQFCLDTRRVYSAGHSGGARMSSVLACQLSDRIAAVAPVVGLRAGMPLKSDPSRPDPESCKPSRAMPIITFHGTDDRTNPYKGGGNEYWQYSVETAVGSWAALNGCRPAPVVTKVAEHVERRRFEGCRSGVVVEFNRIDAPQSAGGGHTWPGSTRRVQPANGAEPNVPSTEINASERIWEFFSQYHL